MVNSSLGDFCKTNFLKNQELFICQNLRLQRIIKTGSKIYELEPRIPIQPCKQKQTKTAIKIERNLIDFIKFFISFLPFSGYIS